MTIRKANRAGKRVLVVDITWKKADGTKGRYRRDAQVQTMAAATAEERRYLANIATHDNPHGPAPAVAPQVTASEAVTFGAAVASYQRTTAIARLKPTTRRGYEEVFTTRLLPRWKDEPLDRIDLDTMTKLDAGMVREGLSISRRRNVMICVRSVIRAAHAEGHLGQLPTFPPLPRKGRRVLSVITTAQLQQILDVSPPSWRLAFCLAAYAGLRAGEVRGLRWRDVDLTGRLLVVRHSRSKGVTTAPKSGDERPIPIAAALHDLLVTHRRGNGDGNGGLVATTGKGQPWGESGLLQAFRRAQAKAGLDGWRFHDLRHYFVTALFGGGGSAPAVQALAGHLHLSTTQRYAHVVPGDLRATIRIFDGRGNSVETAN